VTVSPPSSPSFRIPTPRSIEDDELTREMLVTIGDDERATLAWFHAAFDERRESSTN
jgi:hypothetical protein